MVFSSSSPSGEDEDGAVILQAGVVVAGRWKIVGKLGEGGCGTVYKVLDIRSKKMAALKAESNRTSGGSVLKIEVQILKRLRGRKCIPNLLQSGKRTLFSYMVTTLLGPSLDKLLDICGGKCSISTQIRAGVQMLYGLKQLHEIGFVHRDVKPANLAVGLNEYTRLFHMLDFGLAREFIIRRQGCCPVIRKPRNKVLFRGTTHYCSTAVQLSNEQGRKDDLWSMLYVMVEMRGKLPWDRCRGAEDILRSKLRTSDSKLFSHSPVSLSEISEHLRKLTYYSRPNYSKIFGVFTNIMEVSNISYSDPYDWDGVSDHSLWNLSILNFPKTIIEKVKSIAVVEFTSSDSTLGDSPRSEYCDQLSSPARTPSPRTCSSPSVEFRDPNELLYDLFTPGAFRRNDLGF